MNRPSTLTPISSTAFGAFDWYAATFSDLQRDEALDMLAAGLCADVRAGQPMHGYSEGWEIFDAGGVVARLLSGGGNGNPHAWASGEESERFAALLRDKVPDTHRVSRFDSCVDFGGVDDSSEMWDLLYALCVEHAQENNLKTSIAGDYIGGVDGRTLYIGSRKSDVFVRLYEKGKQLRVMGLETGQPVSLDWVRLEIQVRPQKDARYVAAKATPEEAWGFSKWTRSLLAKVVGLDVPRVTMQVHRETEDEHALGWMIRQYGGALGRIADAEGWDSVLERVKHGVILNRLERDD